MDMSPSAAIRDYLGGSKPRMHSFDAVWRSSCSRFKHCARHSGIRSPKCPNRCHRPSGHRWCGPAVEDAGLRRGALIIPTASVWQTLALRPRGLWRSREFSQQHAECKGARSLELHESNSPINRLYLAKRTQTRPTGIDLQRVLPKEIFVLVRTRGAHPHKASNPCSRGRTSRRPSCCRHIRIDWKMC